MASSPLSLFNVTIQDLRQLLHTSTTAFPELEEARATVEQPATEPRTRRVLEQTEPLLAGIESVPQTSYSGYRLFRENGERSHKACLKLSKAEPAKIAEPLPLS